MHQVDHENANVQQSAETAEDAMRFSTLRFLIVTIGGIFLAEVVAMLLLLNFRNLPYYLQTLTDATIMVVLVFPIVYTFSLRPLLLHIKKRQQAEKQLREMALFPALNPDAVLQVDAAGRIMKSNPSGDQMGFSTGARLTELIPDLVSLDLPTCIATGITQPVYETQLGACILRWVIRGAPELGLAFFYSTDVTERRRAEAANRQLSRIVEQTEDSVVVTDREGVIEYVNPAFERLTGYTKEEALGKTPRVIKSGVHDNEFYRILWNTILKGEVFQSEIANLKKNGELFYEVKTITPLRDSRGDITHFVATGKDITKHKHDEAELYKAYNELELRVQQRTEELVVANTELVAEVDRRKKAQIALEQSQKELSESEKRARHLIQYAPAAIYEMDFFGQSFLSVNDIACQWSGYTREEMLGMSPLDLMDAASKDTFQKSVKAKLSGENVDEAVEYKIIAKDGHEIITEMYVGALTYKDGRPESVLVVVHDITERKRIEMEIQQYADELRAKNEELIRFNRAMVGRELHMMKLKKEVNELCQSTGQSPRYSLDFQREEWRK